MIGDHHGRTAGRATLLVRAVDEILGTHKTTRKRDTPYGDRREGLLLRFRRCASPLIAAGRPAYPITGIISS